MSIIVFHGQAVAFLGSLDRVGAHRHAAPAVVVGVSHPIVFRAEGEAEVTAPGAFIAPGVRHEVYVAQQEALVVYVEPGSRWARALMRACARAAVVPVRSAEPWCTLATILSASMSDAVACTASLTVALDALLGTGTQQCTDVRIAQALDQCRHGSDHDEARVARQLCLSGSRLRHLFVADTGTTLSRYRLWCRLRRAVMAVMNGSSLTVAAMEAGFFDSAHFSRSFRDMFGVSPSAILAREDLSFVAEPEGRPDAHAATGAFSLPAGIASTAP